MVLGPISCSQLVFTSASAPRSTRPRAANWLSAVSCEKALLPGGVFVSGWVRFIHFVSWWFVRSFIVLTRVGLRGGEGAGEGEGVVGR